MAKRRKSDLPGFGRHKKRSVTRSSGKTPSPPTLKSPPSVASSTNDDSNIDLVVVDQSPAANRSPSRESIESVASGSASSTTTDVQPIESNNGSFSSDQVNRLIYHYLVESGFSHSAFTFLNEAKIITTADQHQSPPVGALITMVNKGVQYCIAEQLASPILSQEAKSRLLEPDHGGLSLFDFITTDVHQRLCTAIFMRETNTKLEYAKLILERAIYNLPKALASFQQLKSMKLVPQSAYIN